MSIMCVDGCNMLNGTNFNENLNDQIESQETITSNKDLTISPNFHDYETSTPNVHYNHDEDNHDEDINMIENDI